MADAVDDDLTLLGSTATRKLFFEPTSLRAEESSRVSLPKLSMVMQVGNRERLMRFTISDLW